MDTPVFFVILEAFPNFFRSHICTVCREISIEWYKAVCFCAGRLGVENTRKVGRSTNQSARMAPLGNDISLSLLASEYPELADPSQPQECRQKKTGEFCQGTLYLFPDSVPSSLVQIKAFFREEG